MWSFVRKIIYPFFFLLVCIELILRFGYGFCHAPLYIKDSDYEYIYAPDQTVKRYGNIIKTNSLSMRSEEVLPSDSTIVLLTGDSVVNGGSLTDNEDLASTLLEAKLSETLGKPVRVLNISAGSWGPDNVAAYLKKHGTFGARLICLVTSSHDSFDLMTHHDQVGVDPNLPDKQYKIALVELWHRYLYPIYFRNIKFNSNYYAPLQDSITLHASEESFEGIRKDGSHFNPGYGELREIARQQNIPFFIYLHPEISEVTNGFYNDQGQAIIEFAQRDSIRLIKEMDNPPQIAYFRKHDVIHYNREGQRFMAEQLYPLFLEYLQSPN